MKLPIVLILCLGVSAPLFSETLSFSDGKAYAGRVGLRLTRYSIRHVGTAKAAPLARTEDGGLLLIGSTKGIYSRARLVRLDKRGRKLWARTLRYPGLKAFEGESILRLAPGKYVIYVKSYVHPARGSKTWLLCVSLKGKTFWRKMFRGGGSYNTPFVDEIFMAQGKIQLIGHIYPTRWHWRKEKSRSWRGIMNLKGKLLKEETETRKGDPR